ncbi:hypothetical protein P7228_14015 [Altererythrobacter arenosus]|uniref:PEGA domain-containing protein n=1 Tax=Altererythrobacter arenosus TaxID=3032592 RepID=A0ABY8FQP1_9SPHN|nr:hypothetical protein [Altererythrobacter sp. CAU 1644]WFL77092.1 hypothetical protein P7228_14015 [Altererythrobacter sp. CAU 1644]
MRSRGVFPVLLASAVAACGPNYFVKGHSLAPAESVTIATYPTGALATNAQGNRCVTPCKLPLLTGDGGEITISKEGYHTERHYVGVQDSKRKLAMRSADLAVEAIDPDPVTMGLTLLAHAASGKGGVQELDVRSIQSELIPLKEGEEDLLAPAQPVTGERIPIDLSDSTAP